MRERRREYELMFIISPLHSGEEEIASIIDRLRQTVEGEGGEVTSAEHSTPWGRRKLAYPIRAYAGGEASRRNFSEGYYVLMHFTMLTSRVVELERALKLSDAVLRYLITLVDRKRRSLPSDMVDLEAEELIDEEDEDLVEDEE